VEDYTRFWNESAYGERRGKTAQSLSINRIDNSRGYHADNIEAVTLSLNSRLRYAPIPGWFRAEVEKQSAEAAKKLVSP